MAAVPESLVARERVPEALVDFPVRDPYALVHSVQTKAAKRTVLG
jgi:hypothetical protein